MIDYQKELNPEQNAVVQNGDGPCLVLAGAGSGKTRTITFRVAYLLEHGVRPDEILLVTFTNKAAREMVHRVEHLPIETTEKIRLPWSGTFHHIAFRLLKQYASLLGYQNNFTVLDSEDSKDILKLSTKVEGVDKTQKRFPSAAVIQSLISFSRNAGRSLTEVLEEKYPHWSDLGDVIGRIAADYSRRKIAANAMDFDDLLTNLYRLLANHENVRQKLATQFKYVLVDEYQDTNKIQAMIIQAMASVHHNVLVVGDDAQSIYSFRAADIQNILDFQTHYPGAKIFKLETNYRSTPDILDVANEVIANNTKQYKKELKSVRERFTKPEVHAFLDQAEEADFVAGRILEMRDEGVPLSQIAVLFRAAFHSQALELQLNKRNIPYDYRGGIRFFERAHVKDALAFLRIFSNQKDTIAWSRVLSLQSGIGPAAAEKIIALILPLEERLTEYHLDIVSQSIPARARVGWNDFSAIWRRLVRDSAEMAGPGDLLRAVLDSKYIEYLEAEYPDFRERRDDLEQLSNLADREPDLAKFLAESVLQEQFTKPGVNVDDEKIVLSTIHQAKGLEWEAVFILNVAAGQFPHERSLGEPGGVEEERRLFYVAVTRAKKHLHLSYPLTGNMHSYLQGPSQFLNEVDRDLLEFTDTGPASDLVFSDPSDGGDGITYVPDEDVPFPTKKRPLSFLKNIDEL